MTPTTHASVVPPILFAAVFLIVYAAGVAYLFVHKVNGCRRRWAPLDFVWVPMGGLVGVLILTLWWQSH